MARRAVRHRFLEIGCPRDLTGEEHVARVRAGDRTVALERGEGGLDRTAAVGVLLRGGRGHERGPQGRRGTTVRAGHARAALRREERPRSDPARRRGPGVPAPRPLQPRTSGGLPDGAAAVASAGARPAAGLQGGRDRQGLHAPPTPRGGGSPSGPRLSHGAVAQDHGQPQGQFRGARQRDGATVNGARALRRGPAAPRARPEEPPGGDACRRKLCSYGLGGVGDPPMGAP